MRCRSSCLFRGRLVPGFAAVLAAGALAVSALLTGCIGEQSRRRPAAPRAVPVLPVEAGDQGAVSVPDAGFEPLGRGEASPAGDALVQAGGGNGGGGNGGGNGAGGQEEAPPPLPRPRPAAAGGPRSAQDVLDELRNRVPLELLEADYEKDLGDKAFQDANYSQAVKHYSRALELNPTLTEARQRLRDAQMSLGLRTGEAAAIGSNLVEQDRVRSQMIASDIRQGIREAEELISKELYEDAERKLGRVHDEMVLNRNRLPEDMSAEEKRVKDLIQTVGEQKRSAELDRRRREEEIASSEADRLRKDEEEQRRQQVRQLTLQVYDYLRFREYQKAIEACDKIIALDPNHRVARFWRKDAQQQLLDVREAQLIKTDLEMRRLNKQDMERSMIPTDKPFNFPSREEWDLVKKRKERLEVRGADDPPAIRAIKSILETVEVSFEFQQKPLTDAIAFLRQVTGINIDIDPAVASAQHTVDLTVQNIKALNALNIILKQTDLAYTFQEQILYITEKDKALGTLDFQIYPVADILNKIRDFEGPTLRLKSSEESATDTGGNAGIDISAGSVVQETTLNPDELIDLIKESTGGDEVWSSGINDIQHHQGLLFVNAPRELHKEIQAVLENLREDSDLFVMIEARFIDITDDFLQDIGIDSRALGAVNNLGTPFGNIINDSRTGGTDLGIVKQGSPTRDITLIMGQDRWAGRIQHILDGFTGLISGDRLRGGPGQASGLTVQSTWLDPFQLNAILRAVQEKSDVRQLTAPTVTAHNGQRVYVSVITQRAYIADYELVSGGTGFAIIEVADPVVATFQEGVILDVKPVISADKRYITMDVRPTMATLIGGVISTILISLGSFTNVAFQVPIGVPQVSLQQSYTSVTVPNGGTVLLGGFKSLSESKFTSYIPFLGKIPVIKNLFRRKAEVSEKRSLVILISGRIVNPRMEEAAKFNEN